MNTMVQKQPLLSELEKEALKQKAREDFEKEVLERHEATVKKYRDKKKKGVK